MFFALNAIILHLLFLEVNKMNVLSLYANIFQSISCNYIYGDCAERFPLQVSQTKKGAGAGHKNCDPRPRPIAALLCLQQRR